MNISTIYQLRQNSKAADYWIVRIIQNKSSQNATTVYITKNIKHFFSFSVTKINELAGSRVIIPFNLEYAPILIAQAESLDKLRYKIPWLLL